MVSYGLLDTSAVIAGEHRGSVHGDGIPDELFVSIVTVAELQVGVHAARDAESRARRMKTLDGLAGLEILPADADAATEWSLLRYRVGEARRRVNVNDLWIASIALAHGLPVVTRDAAFDVLEDLGGPALIRI